MHTFTTLWNLQHSWLLSIWVVTSMKVCRLNEMFHERTGEPTPISYSHIEPRCLHKLASQSVHPSHHDLTHPVCVKVVGAGIQKHAYNLHTITLHSQAQGWNRVLFWRVFRCSGEQKIVMILTSAYRYNHEIMSVNADVDLHDPSWRQTYQHHIGTFCSMRLDQNLIWTIRICFGLRQHSYTPPPWGGLQRR